MNKQTAILSLALLLCCSLCRAQQISGTVYDSTNKKPIANAVVAILTPKDSMLVQFTRSGSDGKFTLNKVPIGKYIFMTTHPIYADVLDDIQTTADGLQMNVVNIIPKSKLLQEVIVRTGSPIRIKGDTVSYTADSFKVGPNANVEELLRKLPGIQVGKNGEIKAMGEKVEKVLVDGEEFFGDDPGMAVKNLRADAVKEVQVFDKKSDQAEFTGIDDGQKKKTINLKLKDDRKKGYFGKMDAAAGPQKSIDNRYNTNAMFNAFKGKRKISAFLLNGNTGQDGLSWQDNEKFGGENDNVSMSMDEEGGMMMMWRGGGSDEEPNINTENGFITNTNAGIHYSNKWNDKQNLMLSPKFNSQLYNNRQTNFTQRQIGDSLLNDNSIVDQDINRRNFKNTLIFDTKFDSSNSLKITTKANFYNTASSEFREGNTKSNTNTLKNEFSRLYNQQIDKSAFSVSALFRHKFKKARRSLSINSDFNLLQTAADNLLQSNNQSYVDGLPFFNLKQNQQIEIDKSTQKFSSKAVYTEPLNKKYALEMSYEISVSTGNNDQETRSFTPGTGKYDERIDSLSNNFDQQIVIHRPATKISYNFKKIKFNFGSGFGITKFDFKDITEDKLYERRFTNFFPAASFNYSYKPNHSINFSYNGNTTQPTLNQLQPIRNNNDFFNQFIGNPDLKQSFTHSFNINHNSYNFLKELWTYQSFNVRAVDNSITNSITFIIDSGKTITQPINTDGNISINFWSGVGTKIKKLGLNVNINPNFNYSRFADVINGRTSFSQTLNSGLSIWLSKNKEKKYDISIGNDLSYSRNTTSQNNLVNSFWMNTLNVNATVYYKKVWSATTEYSFFARQKTAQFQNQLNNHLWNARVQRTFKKDEFTAYILIRDILNQNIGIDRNFFGNTTTETTNLRLQRYFMIGFTWNFKNMGAKTPEKKP